MAKNKPMIICIIGPSGSGKTYLAHILEGKYGIKMIESRTTRKPRHHGEMGHTFVSDEEFDSYKKEDMLAYTQWGDVRYCCLEKDITDPVMAYVIDEFGLKYFRENFSTKFRIFAVRIFASAEQRIERVGKERVSRDEGKFTMPDQYFDYFIDNQFDHSLEDKADALVTYLKNHK